MASLVAQLVKNPPAMQVGLVQKNPPAMQVGLVQFLGQEDPLEKG